jgi:hypothetical protein
MRQKAIARTSQGIGQDGKGQPKLANREARVSDA